MAMGEITLTEEELRLMSFFSMLTGVTPKDCIIDDRFNRIIFVVDEGVKIPKDKLTKEALSYLRRKTSKDIEVVEYSSDPAQLIKNALGNKGIHDVKIVVRSGNNKVCLVSVDPRTKGLVVGRQGRNAERARLIARRYLGVNRVYIS